MLWTGAYSYKTRCHNKEFDQPVNHWIIVRVLAAGGTAFMAIKRRKNRDDAEPVYQDKNNGYMLEKRKA